MKIQPDYRWIKESDCNNESLKIVGYQPTDRLLYLQNKEELLQMQLFGKNLNFMCYQDTESDNWIGKTIKVKQESIKGKNIRTIVSYNDK